MDDVTLDDLLPDDGSPGAMPRPGDLSVSTLVAGEVKRTTPDATLYEVAARMSSEGIGALVVDDGGDGEDEAVAVVTERDLVWCSGDASVAEVAELMSERFLRHVLVEEAGELIGIVSARDLLGVYAAAEDLLD